MCIQLRFQTGRDLTVEECLAFCDRFEKKMIDGTACWEEKCSKITAHTGPGFYPAVTVIGGDSINGSSNLSERAHPS